MNLIINIIRGNIKRFQLMNEGGRILVIIADECPLIRNGLKNIVCNEKIDSNVVEVDNLEKLIVLLQKQNINILIFGLNNKFDEFLQNMSEFDECFTNVKVIVLERWLDYSLFRRARSIGIHGYLLKNAPIEDIIDALHMVIRNKRYFDYDIFTKLEEINYTIDSRLTKRECEVYYLVAKGERNEQIAKTLFISPNTVKKHVSSILTKLKLIDRRQIIILGNKSIV